MTNILNINLHLAATNTTPMKNSYRHLYLMCFSVFVNFAQSKSISGVILESFSFSPVEFAIVKIENTSIKSSTQLNGEFSITFNSTLKNGIITIQKEGYITKRIPVTFENKTLKLEEIFLEKRSPLNSNYSIINISLDELNDENEIANNSSGLLQSSMDLFSRTAAFEFSSSFFSIKGLDSKYNSVSINGIELNKLYDQRPQWSNWGGLNDVDNNQEIFKDLKPNKYNFGGLTSTSHINMSASSYNKGGKITVSSSNRSYNNRILTSYATGKLKRDWYVSFALGKRWGKEGFQKGTNYNSNSLFFSIEKKLNNHSINFTSIYTPTHRGKSSPNTQEVYNLKDITYNEYWGYLNGKKRNSRIKRIEEPLFILSHDWKISNKTKLFSSLAYQFGEIGNSRIDYGGTDYNGIIPEGNGSNPSPAYYQKLPSYYFRQNSSDYTNAYLANQEFTKNGQIDWNSLYDANLTNTTSGGNAVYTLYEDITNDKLISFNSVLQHKINSKITLFSNLRYKKLDSENFAEIIDLFGANGYLDVDGYANVDYYEDGSLNLDTFQNNLNTPFRIAKTNEKVKYHYKIYSNEIKGNIQGQFNFNKIDFYTTLGIQKTNYQRQGIFNNGGFPDKKSFEKGRKINFNTISTKTGFTYKFNGKHFFEGNFAYLNLPPTIRNTYSNPRENHDIIGELSNIKLTPEKILYSDLSYIFRNPILKGRITPYFLNSKNGTNLSFYYADGLGGENSAFVQEILQNVEKQNLGIEFGIEFKITPTFLLKGVSSIGQFTYNNNPNLYLTTEPQSINESQEQNSFTNDLFKNGYYNFGKASLKNYKLSNGPQSAHSIGFEYRDPKYWWVGLTTNFFSRAFASINHISRTENFSKDSDGNTFINYNPETAKKLLKQEQFKSYSVVNLNGGKSWRVKHNYLSLFIGINNVLNTIYKTGGFEQARNANYQLLKQDKSLQTPVFGNKYWYGRGTNFFINLAYKF